ncbi:hypothetical protein CLOM_g823 [Closterium sp. NIES-68]|nr:hypothetical protein CLOM_g823 [Closterium sp. NIES-68]GJP71281.1 hypothetical protein CLOP_g2130 [Closterium sp. NIES-67]
MTVRVKLQQPGSSFASSLTALFPVHPASFFSNRPVRLVFVGSLLLCLCILLSDLLLQSSDDTSAAPGAASPAVAAAVASGRYPTRLSPHDTLGRFRGEARGGGGAEGGTIGGAEGGAAGDGNESVRILHAEIARYREGQNAVIEPGFDSNGGRGDGGRSVVGGEGERGEMGGARVRGEGESGGGVEAAAMDAFIPSLSDGDGDTSEEGLAESASDGDTSAADGPQESAASSAEEQASALLAADSGTGSGAAASTGTGAGSSAVSHAAGPASTATSATSAAAAAAAALAAKELATCKSALQQCRADLVSSAKSETSSSNSSSSNCSPSPTPPASSDSSTTTPPASSPPSPPAAPPGWELQAGSIPSGPLSAIREKIEELNSKLDDARSALAQSEKERAQLAAELAQAHGSGGGTGGAGGAGGGAAGGRAVGVAGASAASRSPGFGLCMASTEEMRRYLNYSKRAACPDDWRFVEHLRFARNCLHLPRRRCRATALTPLDFQEYTLGFPAAVFVQEALRDENVRWGEGMKCRSYKECVEVNAVEGAACKGCFDVQSERHWWDKSIAGTIPLAAFLKLKSPGALRIGLDVGGGTGGFAALLAQHNITIVTTGMNTDEGKEDEKAVPYMQTIAQRGLVPLYLPHSAPLPFFDNTLDLIHTLNSVKYPHLAEFEAMLFEWDRVLRPGGLWWIELFYAPEKEMKAYVRALEGFGYGRRYWSLVKKQGKSERTGKHLFLTCVLEKPLKI